MKTLLVVVAVLVAIPLLLILIGCMLPRGHTATRAAQYARPALELYRIARDFPRQPEWRLSVKSIELLPDADGKVRFKEVSGNGALIYIVEADVAGQRLVTRIDDRGMPFGGTWTIIFAPTPDAAGTVVRITEEGFVRNPLFRVMSRFFTSPTATMETYLRDLGRQGGEAVRIDP